MTTKTALRDLLQQIDSGEVNLVWDRNTEPSRLQDYKVVTMMHPLKGFKIRVYIDTNQFDYIESIHSPSGERVMLYGDGQVDDYFPADLERWGLR